MHRVAVAIALFALAACGGKDKPESSAEASPATGSAAAVAKPAKAPEKAASRGPEHPVYSLIDNRLHGHLRRGGGIVVPGGSAGMAKYVRFGNVMHSAKKTWELRQTHDDAKVARLT